MKRLGYLFLMFIALLISCSKENEQIISDETYEISFKLDVESIPSTRAISDGSGATQLMYAVFTENGDLVIPKEVENDVEELNTEAGYTLRITLARGQQYKAVFWAQNPECEAYTVSDDMKLAIDYEGVNNDELRDAFYGVTETFTVSGNKTISVILKRPFAQVNVGSFPYDYEYAQKLGLDIKLSQAIIYDVPDKMDMFNGEVDGNIDIAYSLNDIPEEDLVIDINDDGVYESYTYLSMSYILAATESSNHSMHFIFSEKNSKAVVNFYEGLDYVPVQRNWRTNIVGQILTGDISFNVKIDPIYDGETHNSGGLYYNFGEAVYIEDKEFVFNTNEAATFTSENNTLVSLKDVTFSGRVEQIAFGEYRDKGNYVEFTNTFENVKATDMVVTHPVGIANVETIDYMAPLIFLRGENTLTNCTLTGTTSIAPDKTDYNGDVHKVIAYDCGVPNKCSAVFNNSTVDKLYAWSHSKITLKGTKMKYIRCSTHNQSEPDAHLTIDSGSVVDEIYVTSTGLAKFETVGGKRTLVAEIWPPSLIIKAGAKVKLLDMNKRPSVRNSKLSVIIEEGAIVEKIINAIDVIPNAPVASE